MCSYEVRPPDHLTSGNTPAALAYYAKRNAAVAVGWPTVGAVLRAPGLVTLGRVRRLPLEVMEALLIRGLISSGSENDAPNDQRQADRQHQRRGKQRRGPRDPSQRV